MKETIGRYVYVLDPTRYIFCCLLSDYFDSVTDIEACVAIDNAVLQIVK